MESEGLFKDEILEWLRGDDESDISAHIQERLSAATIY